MAVAIDRDTVAVRRPIDGEHQNHLEAREGPHESRVRLPQPREVLRGHEREVHARLEDVALLGGAIEEIALGMPDVVGDRVVVLRDENVGRVTGEALAEGGKAIAESGAEQESARPDRSAAQHDRGGADAILAGLPFRWAPLLP